MRLSSADLQRAHYWARHIPEDTKAQMLRASDADLKRFAHRFVKDVKPVTKYNASFQAMMVGLSVTVVGIPIVGLMALLAEVHYRYKREYYHQVYVAMQRSLQEMEIRGENVRPPEVVQAYQHAINTLRQEVDEQYRPRITLWDM